MGNNFESAIITTYEAVQNAVSLVFGEGARIRVLAVVTITDLSMTMVVFVCVMAWGSGTIGVGPVPARWVLTGVGNRGAFQEPLSRTGKCI